MEHRDESNLVQQMIAIGRRRGGLTMRSIKSLLPINEMTEEQIAGVICRVEEAGVPIEIDAPLGQLNRTTQPVRADTRSASKSATGAGRFEDSELTAHAAPSVPDVQPDARANRSVLLAALMSCGAILLAGWVWQW